MVVWRTGHADARLPAAPAADDRDLGGQRLLDEEGAAVDFDGALGRVHVGEQAGGVEDADADGDEAAAEAHRAGADLLGPGAHRHRTDEVAAVWGQADKVGRRLTGRRALAVIKVAD